MARKVNEPTPIDPHRFPDNGPSVGGDGRNLVPAGGDPRLAQYYSPPPSYTAIWVVIVAITRMFAAFTSALIVRKGSSLDWRTFKLPSILIFSSGLLLASSVTLEISRHRIAAFMSSAKNESESPARWLYVTLFLGLLFLAGHYVAWSQLRAQGLYLAPNSSSSFF